MPVTGRRASPPRQANTGLAGDPGSLGLDGRPPQSAKTARPGDLGARRPSPHQCLSPHALGFDSDEADAADKVIGSLLAFFHGEHLDRVGLVMRAQDEVVVGDLDVLDSQVVIVVLADGVHVVLALAIGGEGVIVTVEEEGGAGQHARIHTHAFAGVHFDDDEAFPAVTVAFHGRAEAAEESLLEFQDFLHVHVHDEGFGGGDVRFGDNDAFEFVLAGGDDGSPFVDFGGVEQVEDGEMLNSKDLIHPFQAETALAIEKVGDMCLLEAGLFGQAQAGKFPFVNTLPKSFAKIVLQSPEFHGGSIARNYSNWLFLIQL